MGIRMWHDAMGWDIDYGYIKACDVIKAELERIIKEHIHMESTELNQIKQYWVNKYPNIDITLYPHVEGDKFFGKMMAHDCSFDINADTIGELITQGENFLRKVTK